METLMLIAVALVPIGLVVDNLRSPSAAHAQTIEQANKNLSKTERDLRTAATTTNAQAAGIQQGLANPDRTQLPKELQDLDLSSQRLTTLRENLGKDISKS